MCIRFLKNKKKLKLKLFDTIDEMQLDSTAKAGDLAIVYRKEQKNISPESEFSSCVFPNTVMLPEIFAGYVWGRFRATDSSSDWFDGNINLSSSSFQFMGSNDSGEITIRYESTDGKKYTRIDGGDEIVNFGIPIKFENEEEWNNNIGYFMKVGGNYFEGLYENSTYNIDGTFNFFINKDTKQYLDKPFLLPDITTYERVNTGTYSNCTQYSECHLGITKYHLDDSGQFYIVDKCRVVQTYGGYLALCEYHDKWYARFTTYPSTSGTYYIVVEDYDFSQEIPLVSSTKYTADNAVTDYSNFLYMGKSKYDSNTTYYGIEMPGTICGTIGASAYIHYGVDSIPNDDNKWDIITLGSSSTTVQRYKYQLANNQLSAKHGNVYNATFYGKKGIEAGTLSQNTSSSFNDVDAEIFNVIQDNYDNMEPVVFKSKEENIPSDLITIPTKRDGTVLLDTSNVTETTGMFSGCKKLKNVSLLDTSNVTNMDSMFFGCSNLVSVPLFNTTNVTKMSIMFFNCTNLTTIPIFDTNNVQTMNSMFSNCIKLNEASLNNILQMCTNATSYNSTKSLKQIGLTSEQATKCQSLSNYTSFVQAGWTTGY